MKITEQEAYRLGSMPRRACILRCRARWPESDLTEEMLSFVGEWTAILSKLRVKALLNEVKMLKQQVLREQEAHQAQQDHT